jgi:hypothetical protein
MALSAANHLVLPRLRQAWIKAAKKCYRVCAPGAMASFPAGS